MADLEARREARMRKILENSESRLRKITGGIEKSPINSLNSVHENCIEPATHNLPRRHIPEPAFDNYTDDITIINHNLLPNLLGLATEHTEDADQALNQHQAADTRNHLNRSLLICLIAIIYCVTVTVFNKISTDSFYNSQLNAMFAPLLIYELYELIFAQDRPCHVSSVMSYVLLFIENKWGRDFVNVVKILFKVGDFLHDVFLYFFVFVTCKVIVDSIV